MEPLALTSLVAVGGLVLGALVVVTLAARALFIHHVIRQAESALFQLQNVDKELLARDADLRGAVRTYQVAKLRQDLGRQGGSLLRPARALIQAYQDRLDARQDGSALRVARRPDWSVEASVDSRAAASRLPR